MNRRLVIVYITGLLIGVSYGLHGPLLPIFAKDVIGASYAELGVIGFANFIPYMFFPLFVGIFLNKFKNWYLVSIGVIINGSSGYWLAIAESVPEIRGFRVMTGVGHANAISCGMLWSKVTVKLTLDKSFEFSSTYWWISEYSSWIDAFPFG